MNHFRRLDGCCHQMSHSIHTFKVQTLTVTFKLQREIHSNHQKFAEQAGPAGLPHRCGAHKLWVNFLVCFPLQAFQFFFSLWTTQVFVLTAQPSIYCWRFLASLFQFATEKMTRLLSHAVVVLLQECLSQGFLPTNPKANMLSTWEGLLTRNVACSIDLFWSPSLYSPARYSSSERSVLGRRLLTSRATAPPDIWKKVASCMYLQCICYHLVPTCSIHPCFKCVSTQKSKASMAIKNTKKADALFRVEVWQCHMGIFHFLAPTLHGGHTKSQAAAIWITIITILQSC